MEQKTIIASAAQTASFNSVDFGFSEIASARGALFYLNISAVTGTTPTLTMQLQGKDVTSGNYLNIAGAVTASITTTGLVQLALYPGITVAANSTINTIVPNTLRAVFTIGGTTPSFTLTLAGQALA